LFTVLNCSSIKIRHISLWMILQSSDHPHEDLSVPFSHHYVKTFHSVTL
jgi:hypothetical protein